MSVRRKLFVTMAGFIIGMGLVFAFATQIVLRDTLDVLLETAKKAEIGRLSGQLLGYYEQNGSWSGVEQAGIRAAGEATGGEDASFVLLSRESRELYAAGPAAPARAKLFGIRSALRLNGELIGFLCYYDAEADFMSKLRIGILDSTRILLAFGTIVFALVSLLVVYLLAKRLTAPLRLLLPAIARLGKGELGVQAPVVSRDEYGTVAIAFNDMSGQLHNAEQTRKNLVADVAHELRTPLTIIRGKLDLVQQHGRPVAPETLLPLQDDLLRLTRIVDDLHQLSLAEANKLPLERKPIDMSALLRKIVERIAFDADDKSIAITLDSGDDLPTIDADANRLTQVFFNLLVNAVRYTPEGGTVRITAEPAPAARGKRDRLRIAVADSGIGIEPEHLPHLFDRFYRTDEARARHSGGTGLGLAIARQFVQAHDGTIAVESSPGQGTTFVVELPVRGA